MESHLSRLIWLRRLRLVAFFTQLLLLVVAVFIYHLSISVVPVVSALLAIPLSQFVFDWWRKHKEYHPHQLGLLLSFDVLLLTAILYFSGGPTNPFSLVYLVLVVLSAVMVSKEWTWSIAGISSICFAILFLKHTPIPELHHSDGHHGLSLHLQGMLVSYILVAAFVTYFLGKIIDEVRYNHLRLQNLRVNQERLAAMTTVTANAAHELGTPLASLELISGELLRVISAGKLDPVQVEGDLQVLRSEILRCRSIIDEMCSTSGSIAGEQPSWITPKKLVDEAIRSLPGTDRLLFKSDNGMGSAVYIQKGPSVAALRVLLQNAIDATNVVGVEEPVVVSWKQSSGFVEFIIDDRGVGMPAELTERLGEPFVTTKPDGDGMGLGIYIAQLVADQLGGTLKFKCRSGGGTSARISFAALQTEEKIKAA